MNVLILTNPTASGYLVSKLKRGEDVMKSNSKRSFSAVPLIKATGDFKLVLSD